MSRDTTEIYDVVPVFAVDESGKALITEEQYSWLCNYAIRKAERVQELEELVADYKTVNRELHRRRKKVRKQNKRYRERIEYMLEEAKDHKRKGLRIQHWALIKDLEETLEGEE